MIREQVRSGYYVRFESKIKKKKLNKKWGKTESLVKPMLDVTFCISMSGYFFFNGSSCRGLGRKKEKKMAK